MAPISIRYPTQTPLVDASGLIGGLDALGQRFQQRKEDKRLADLEQQNAASAADAFGKVVGPDGSFRPDPEAMRELLRNPQTRSIAVDWAKSRMQPDDPLADLKRQKLEAEIHRLKNPGSGGGGAALPTSIQEFMMAQKNPEYAKWLQIGKGRDSKLTAGDRKAILDAEDSAMASKNTVDMLNSVITPGEDGKTLNEKAGSGATASTQSWLARNDPTGFFDDETGQATTELENVVLNQALSSLKSIFGAAPTEGERKILVDLQASVDKTPAEREAIIRRATQMAERRLQFNTDRADELRGGTYYQEGGGYDPNASAAPAAPEDPLGIR